MALTTFVAGQVLQAQQLNDSYAAVDWNENVVINGAMQVAQRGTSTASITTQNFYTADRFETVINSFGTWTQTVENDAPTGSGFRKSLKMLCTTADAAPAAGDYNIIAQSFEGQNLQLFNKGTTAAKTFVLSFWVKSNVTGTYIARLIDGDNTRQVCASYTITASATWEKKTITFPADTTGAFDNDNAASMRLQFWLGAGTNFTSGTLATTWANEVAANAAVGQTNLASAINNYWQITGVQLQPSRASQFLFEDYGTVLAQCQRYYWTTGGAGKNLCNGYYYTNTNVRAVLTFPVPMRTAPTLTASSGTNYFNFQTGASDDLFDTINASYQASEYNILLGVTSGVSGTSGQAGGLFTNNAAGKIELSAEL